MSSKRPNEELYEWLNKGITSAVDDEGNFVIEHNMPEGLDDFNFADAVQEANGKKTAYLKREFWKDYKKRLDSALQERSSDGLLAKDQELQPAQLFYTINKIIDHLQDQIIVEKAQGIHPTKGNPESLEDRISTARGRVDEVEKYHSDGLTYEESVKKLNEKAGRTVFSSDKSFYSARNQLRKRENQQKP